MKIAVLSSHLPSPDRAKTGGVSYVAHRQANALAQRGHNVTVFTADERPPDACYQVRRVHSARPANPFRAWLWIWQLAFRYSTQDFSGFDIIHAHGNNALIRTGGRPAGENASRSLLGRSNSCTHLEKAAMVPVPDPR